MEHSDPQGPTPKETVFSVPAMTCRHCIRAISTQVRDVRGVVALEAETSTRTIRVQGAADPEAVLFAIAAAGYEAVVLNPSAPGQESTGGHLS